MRRLSIVVPLLTVFLQPGVARAAPAKLDSLLQNSPFQGSTSAQTGPRAETPLEFRGMFVDRGEQFFSLYETSSRSSQWVGLNEPGRPFKVQAFDGDKSAVTVEYQGRTLTLPLKQAKIVALPPMQPRPAGPAPGEGGPQPTNVAGAGGPVPMPTAGAQGPVMATSEEAARLSAVAEEIRRRRALRQQQNTPNAAPAQGQLRPPPRN